MKKLFRNAFLSVILLCSASLVNQNNVQATGAKPPEISSKLEAILVVVPVKDGQVTDQNFKVFTSTATCRRDGSCDIPKLKGFLSLISFLGRDSILVFYTTSPAKWSDVKSAICKDFSQAPKTDSAYIESICLQIVSCTIGN